MKFTEDVCFAGPSGKKVCDTKGSVFTPECSTWQGFDMLRLVPYSCNFMGSRAHDLVRSYPCSILRDTVVRERLDPVHVG